MLQSSACNTVVVVKPQASLPTWTSFAAWLRKHAAIVRKLVVFFGQRLAGLPSTTAAAQQMMLFALELAAGAGATTPQPQQQQQQLQPRSQGLGLCSFCTNCLATTAVLQALQAAKLTHLDLQMQFNGPDPGFVAALGRLTGLQNLLLDFRWAPLPAGALGGVSMLPHLTKLQLTLRGETDAAVGLQHELQQLVDQLQHRELRELKLAYVCGNSEPPLVHTPKLDLGGLSCLWQLELCVSGGLGEGSILPAQLQALNLGNTRTAALPSFSMATADAAACVHRHGGSSRHSCSLGPAASTARYEGRADDSSSSGWHSACGC